MKIHQLLMGRDIACDPSNPVHSMAASMANFCYVIEYGNEKKAFLVDPAWDVQGIFDYVSKLNLNVTCAVFTHRHLDHTGGKVQLQRGKVVVPGLAEVAEKGIPVKVGKDDLKSISGQTGITNLEQVAHGEEFVPGAKVIHTPGHTPGSLCILLNDGEALITGDTLFIGSCGRVDLAESDPEAMAQSLISLSKLPQECRVLPGHNYASLTESSIGRERKFNFAMRDAMSNFMSSNKTNGVVRSSSLPDYVQSARRALNDNL